MLFISPPFGNYIDLHKTTSIRGSFTLNERPGKWSQIIKTLRYIPGLGWVNRIGLRNPGIDYAIKTYKEGEIISIAIMEKEEIKPLLDKIPEDMNIELNVSCPNTHKDLIADGLAPFVNKKRNWCIIKLSPIEKSYDINKFYENGFRQFHASNTLPNEKYGGVSGSILKPHTIGTIRYIKSQFKDVVVIAGGGIRTMKDVEEYRKAGADHFSVSSLCFNPIAFLKFYNEFTNPF